MKRDRLVLATYNDDKVREIKAILGDETWDLISLNGFPPRRTIEETGSTFEANALIKARTAHTISGLPALADDSGLCVDALGGAPGMRSARFAGDHATTSQNNDKLLKLLKRFGPGERRAKFVCCVALVDTEEHVEIGEAFGSIVEAPVGQSGFGYDPLFYFDEKRKTFAEMSPEEKNHVSHRGIAFRKMAAYLKCRGYGA